MTTNRPPSEAADADDRLLNALRDVAQGADRPDDLNDEDRRLVDSVADWLPLLAQDEKLAARVEDTRSDPGTLPAGADPIALVLGLVPRTDQYLDGQQLQKLRKRSALKVSDIAARMNTRGWRLTTNTVFGWERGVATQVAPAIIAALAEELSTTVNDLIKPPSGAADQSVDSFREFLQGDEFADVVARWRDATGLGHDQAVDDLAADLAPAVWRRNGAPDPALVLAVIEALLIKRGLSRGEQT